MRAHAQLDSSSAVLLRPSARTIAPEDLDSSRYRVRMPESKASDDELEEKPGTMVPAAVPPRPRRNASAKTQKTSELKSSTTAAEPAPSAANTATEPKGETAPAESAEIKSPQTSTGDPAPADPAINAPKTAADAATSAEQATTPKSPAPPTPPAPPAPPPLVVQMHDLFLGGTQEEIEEYQRRIHPQDPRANVLSISFAPAYFYEGAQSDYAFRRMSANGPGFGAGMNLWFTPFFGLQSKYFSSVTASVKSGTAQVPMDVQMFDAGIRFRKHFGFSRKAASLSWGVDYVDSLNRISRDSTSNVGRHSSGIGLALEADVPSSNTYVHRFELSLQPRLHHSELATGTTARSGTKNETNALGVALGGQWVLDRRNQMFWRTQYRVERNLFQGQAAATDPQTGVAPDGVSATDSLLIFYFGFKWGS